jgi:hypothetical protein
VNHRLMHALCHRQHHAFERAHERDERGYMIPVSRRSRRSEKSTQKGN